MVSLAKPRQPVLISGVMLSLPRHPKKDPQKWNPSQYEGITTLETRDYQGVPFLESFGGVWVGEVRLRASGMRLVGLSIGNLLTHHGDILAEWHGTHVATKR